MLPQFLRASGSRGRHHRRTRFPYSQQKRGLFDAGFPALHLNDFRSSTLIVLYHRQGSFWSEGLVAALAVWLLLIVMNVDAGAPLGGPIGGGRALGSSSITIRHRGVQPCLLMLMAGVALFATDHVASGREERDRPFQTGVCLGIGGDRDPPDQTSWSVRGVLLSPAPFLFGDKYDW